MQAISATSPLIPLLAYVQPELGREHGPTEPRTSSSPDALPSGTDMLQLPNLSRALTAFLLFSCGQEDIQFCLLTAGQPAARKQIISAL